MVHSLSAVFESLAFEDSGALCVINMYDNFFTVSLAFLNTNHWRFVIVP